MTREETADVLRVLASAWPERFDPRKGVDLDVTTSAYHAAWSDLPAEAVKAAAMVWLREGKFFPAPAELRSRALASSPAPALPAWSYDADLARWGLGVCACGRPAEGIVMGKRLCLEHLHELALVQG